MLLNPSNRPKDLTNYGYESIHRLREDLREYKKRLEAQRLEKLNADADARALKAKMKRDEEETKNKQKAHDERRKREDAILADRRAEDEMKKKVVDLRAHEATLKGDQRRALTVAKSKSISAGVSRDLLNKMSAQIKEVSRASHSSTRYAAPGNYQRPQRQRPETAAGLPKNKSTKPVLRHSTAQPSSRPTRPSDKSKVVQERMDEAREKFVVPLVEKYRNRLSFPVNQSGTHGRTTYAWGAADEIKRKAPQEPSKDIISSDSDSDSDSGLWSDSPDGEEEEAVARGKAERKKHIDRKAKMQTDAAGEMAANEGFAVLDNAATRIQAVAKSTAAEVDTHADTDRQTPTNIMNENLSNVSLSGKQADIQTPTPTPGARPGHWARLRLRALSQARARARPLPHASALSAAEVDTDMGEEPVEEEAAMKQADEAYAQSDVVLTTDMPVSTKPNNEGHNEEETARATANLQSYVRASAERNKHIERIEAVEVKKVEDGAAEGEREGAVVNNREGETADAKKRGEKERNTRSSISNYFMKDNVDNIEKRFRDFVKEYGKDEEKNFLEEDFKKIDKAVIKRAIKELSDPPLARSPQQTDSKFSIRTANALIEVLGRTIKKKKNVKELFDSYNIKITSTELDTIFKNYFENGIKKNKILGFVDSESKDNDSENVEFIVNRIAGISKDDLIELFKKSNMKLNEGEQKTLREKYFKDGKFNMGKLIELYGIK